MISAAGPTLLSEFDSSEVVVVGRETRLSCQLECSPLCGLEWLVDGQNVHNEEGKFKVEEEIIEEDKERNLFSGVKSTLSWTQLEKTLEEISVTCRFSLNAFAKEKHFFVQVNSSG